MSEKYVKDEAATNNSQIQHSIPIERNENPNSRSVADIHKYPIQNIEESAFFQYDPIHKSPYESTFQPHQKPFKCATDSEDKHLKCIPRTPVTLHGPDEMHSLQLRIQNPTASSTIHPLSSILIQNEKNRKRPSHPTSPVKDDSDSFLNINISVKDLGPVQDFLPSDDCLNVPYGSAKDKLNTLEASGLKDRQKLNSPTEESNDSYHHTDPLVIDGTSSSHPPPQPVTEDLDSFSKLNISVRDLGPVENFLPSYPAPYGHAKVNPTTLVTSGLKSHDKSNEPGSTASFIESHHCLETLVIDGKTFSVVTKTDNKKYSKEEDEMSCQTPPIMQGEQPKNSALDGGKLIPKNNSIPYGSSHPSNPPEPQQIYFHNEKLASDPSDHSSSSHSSINDSEDESEGSRSSESDENEADENYEDSLTLRQNKSKPSQITGNLLGSISSEEFEDVYKFNGKGIWNTYGIELNKTLKHHKPRSIDKLLNTRQLDHLAPIERRVTIEGQTFKVVSNDKKTWSLYRAIAQAVTNTEKNHKQIREDILSEIISNWMVYSTEMSNECSFNILKITSLDNPFPLLSAYKAYYRTLSSSGEKPILHLKAAARKFQFNFVIIEFLNNNLAQCINSDGLKYPILYHFLKIRHPLFGTWRYNLLVPIGSMSTSTHETRLLDGMYPISICDALVIYKQRALSEKIKITTDTNFTHQDLKEDVEQSPFICFGLENNCLAYRPTYTHDLWSILSELLCKNLKAAPIIYEAVLRMKLDDSKYYLISKLNKRKLKGKTCSTKLRNQYIQSLKVPPSQENRGSTEDLIQAANSFDFSYTLIGLDNNGNFFWKECISEPSSKSSGSKIALFVRLVGNKETFWYALEFIDKLNPVGVPTYYFTDYDEQAKYVESGSTQPSRRARPSATILPTKQSTTVSGFTEIFSKVNTRRKGLTGRVTNSNVSADQPVNRSLVPLSFATRILSWLHRLRSGRVAPDFNSETNLPDKHYSDIV